MTPEEKLKFGMEINERQRSLQDACIAALGELALFAGQEDKLAVAMQVYLNTVLAPYFMPAVEMPLDIRQRALDLLVNDVKRVVYNCYEMALK